MLFDPIVTLASDLAAAEPLPLPAMPWPLAEAEPAPVTVVLLLELAAELEGVVLAVACTKNANKACDCQKRTVPSEVCQPHPLAVHTSVTDPVSDDGHFAGAPAANTHAFAPG